MSRVVLYRVTKQDGTTVTCTRTGEDDTFLPVGSDIAITDPFSIRLVEYIPASVARGLVEALKECSELMVLPTSADNALAAAEEALR